MNAPVAMTAVPIYRRPRSKSLGARKVRVMISAVKPSSRRSGSRASNESQNSQNNNNSWEEDVFLRQGPSHPLQHDDWHRTMYHQYSLYPRSGARSNGTAAYPVELEGESPDRTGLAEGVASRREQSIYVKTPTPTTPKTTSAIRRQPYPSMEEEEEEHSSGRLHAYSLPVPAIYARSRSRSHSQGPDLTVGVYELEGSTPATSSRASSGMGQRLSDTGPECVGQQGPTTATAENHRSPSIGTSDSSIAPPPSASKCSDTSPALASARLAGTGPEASSSSPPPSPTPSHVHGPRPPVTRSPPSARGVTVHRARSFTATRPQRQSSLPASSSPPESGSGSGSTTTSGSGSTSASRSGIGIGIGIGIGTPGRDIPAVPQLPEGVQPAEVYPDAQQTPSTPSRRPRVPRMMAPPTTSSYASATSAATLNPAATYQHIQDMAAKRISTLDYLRKTHEGRVYWFNTVLFTRPEIMRLPSFQPPRLARRAANLLLLGLSIPQALDANANSAIEYVRALNGLLSEFETYQSIHPPEGGTNSLSSGSFGRSKLPKMFTRGHATSKTRRASTATDIGLPLPPGFDSVVDTGHESSTGAGSGTLNSTNPSASASSATLAGPTGGPVGATAAGGHTTSLPAPDTTLLLPGEEYSYLLTPSLPFEPDFFEVFATLADVLIDVYMRISQLVSSPERVALQPGLAEAFAKADSRIRKVLVLGIVKEFEEATRHATKNELGGVGRVVLGGLA